MSLGNQVPRVTCQYKRPRLCLLCYSLAPAGSPQVCVRSWQ